MVVFSQIEGDPGTLQGMLMPTRALYEMMVEAHKRAAEVLAFHYCEFIKWCEAGKPVIEGPRGLNKAEGYFILTPMQMGDIDDYVREQYQRCKFIGTSYNEFIELSYKDFQEYTVPKYRLRDA